MAIEHFDPNMSPADTKAWMAAVGDEFGSPQDYLKRQVLLHDAGEPYDEHGVVVVLGGIIEMYCAERGYVAMIDSATVTIGDDGNLVVTVRVQQAVGQEITINFN